MVTKLAAEHDLSKMTVGILGMAFKGESDDTRSSLAYKLKRILRFKAGQVICTDPYVRSDPDLKPLETVLAESDLLIIAAPHRRYAQIQTDKPVVDIWNLRHQGARV
jgi:UDP-N-acetyl-D-mannosaminuronic acid dehydrogenase